MVLSPCQRRRRGQCARCCEHGTEIARGVCATQRFITRQGRQAGRVYPMTPKQRNTPEPPELVVNSDETSALLRELVAHLRQNRTQLREDWARRITRAALLTAMTEEEIFAEATSVYDNYVEALATGTFEALQAYARNLSERIIPRGVETHEVVGIVLLLR